MTFSDTLYWLRLCTKVICKKMMERTLRFLCDHKEIALATSEGNLPNIAGSSHDGDGAVSGGD